MRAVYQLDLFSLTPSSWTAADSHWTSGGTLAWWVTWTSIQKYSSSECPLPEVRRVSPAIGTERSEERSAKAGRKLQNRKVNPIQKFSKNTWKFQLPCPQSESSCWDGWVPPSSSLTAHWSYILWWSKKTTWLLLLCLTSDNTGTSPTGY